MMGVMALKEGKNLGVCAHNKRLLVGEANIMPFNFRNHVFPCMESRTCTLIHITIENDISNQLKFSLNKNVWTLDSLL